jgi:hypothetical protein
MRGRSKGDENAWYDEWSEKDWQHAHTVLAQLTATGAGCNQRGQGRSENTDLGEKPTEVVGSHAAPGEHTRNHPERPREQEQDDQEEPKLSAGAPVATLGWNLHVTASERDP